MPNRYETKLKIAEKENKGFQEFKKLVYQINTKASSVTPTQLGWHYDVSYYQGQKFYRVELKYMADKCYV